MTEINTIEKAILVSIKKGDFLPTEIISKYPIESIVKAIIKIIDDRIDYIENNNLADLSESELDNLYLLTKTIISGNTFERRKNSVLKAPQQHTIEPIIPRATLDSMYRLRPAH